MAKSQIINGYPVAEARRGGPRLASIFSDFVVGARDGRDMQARYDELSRMTPGELKRLGLTREDIARVVATQGAVE
jgi:uncharacterized protein YjiS (DUF1127 family)